VPKKRPFDNYKRLGGLRDTMNNQDHDPQTFGVIGENTSSLDDVFNPERLRLSQNFENAIGVKKVLTAVPVRKPDRQSFIRVHPDPAYRLETAVLELKAERETYLVEPCLIPDLPGEVIAKVLFTAVTGQGVVFLWPIPLPDAKGRHNSWSDTALQCAMAAMEKWVRTVPNMDLGGYELLIASAALPEPEWPDLNFRELLRIAFKDKFIRSLDHPVVQKLQGLR
jgi:hypothetical protein